MHFSALTAPEQRVLGCLIEKRFTTPDQYPLSLNALRLAANQSTNRDPVVSYDDHVVNEAAQRLSRYGLARLASGHTSRATKYRHLAEEGLGVDQSELALLAVLLLRGPQTPGELKGRTERMVAFDSLETVDATLEALAQKGYVTRLARRPGQKEERWRQLLGGDGPEAGETGGVAAVGVTAVGGATDGRATGASAAPPARSGGVVPQTSPPASATHALEARVTALEAEVAELRARLIDVLGE